MKKISNHIYKKKKIKAGILTLWVKPPLAMSKAWIRVSVPVWFIHFRFNVLLVHLLVMMQAPVPHSTTAGD